MARPPSEIMLARLAAKKLREDAITPQIARATRLRSRCSSAAADLKAAMTALERAADSGAGNAVLVPLRQVLVDAREAQRVVRAEAVAAGVFKPEKTPAIRARERIIKSRERLKAAIKTIRAGGYTPATRDRLIEKAKELEEKRLQVADMLTHHPDCVSGKGSTEAAIKAALAVHHTPAHQKHLLEQAEEAATE